MILVQLISVCPSMDDQERLMWYRNIPKMSKSQIDRIENALLTEQIKLKELDEKYNKEIAELNKKHAEEWALHLKQSHQYV